MIARYILQFQVINDCILPGGLGRVWSGQGGQRRGEVGMGPSILKSDNHSLLLSKHMRCWDGKLAYDLVQVDVEWVSWWGYNILHTLHTLPANHYKKERKVTLAYI